MTPPVNPDLKSEVDQVLEAIIYLYTESRRITKELAKRADLTGPQLTVIKLLEQVGDLSLSELSDKIRAQNSTVTGIIDRMERERHSGRADGDLQGCAREPQRPGDARSHAHHDEGSEAR
jgi:hypothetical protein